VTYGRCGLADEVDLEAGHRIQQTIGQGGSADVKPAMRPMDEDHVRDASLGHDLLQAACHVGGLAPNDFRAQIDRIVDVALDVLLPVPRQLDARGFDGDGEERGVQSAGD
jgi:hypothetical protein